MKKRSDKHPIKRPTRRKRVIRKNRRAIKQEMKKCYITSGYWSKWKLRNPVLRKGNSVLTSVPMWLNAHTVATLCIVLMWSSKRTTQAIVPTRNTSAPTSATTSGTSNAYGNGGCDAVRVLMVWHTPLLCWPAGPRHLSSFGGGGCSPPSMGETGWRVLNTRTWVQFPPCPHVVRLDIVHPVWYNIFVCHINVLRNKESFKGFGKESKEK